MGHWPAYQVAHLDHGYHILSLEDDEAQFHSVVDSIAIGREHPARKLQVANQAVAVGQLGQEYHVRAALGRLDVLPQAGCVAQTQIGIYDCGVPHQPSGESDLHGVALNHLRQVDQQRIRGNVHSRRRNHLTGDHYLDFIGLHQVGHDQAQAIKTRVVRGHGRPQHIGETGSLVGLGLTR